MIQKLSVGKGLVRTDCAAESRCFWRGWEKLSVCGETGWTVLDRRCQHSHRSQHPSAIITLSSLVMDIGTHLSMYFYFGKVNDHLVKPEEVSAPNLGRRKGLGKMGNIICVNTLDWKSASSSCTFTACIT